MRRPLTQVSYQPLLPIRLRAQLQNLLLTEEIERQRACDYKGQEFRGFTLHISGIVLEDQSVADLVESHELTPRACVGAMLTVSEEVDIAFQELIVRVGVGVHQLGYAERRAANGDDVHAAVVVTLHDFGDIRGATHADNSFRQSQEHSELAFMVDALADHLAVARLENVQGENCAGKKNDVQREKRNTFRPHETHS